MVVRSADGSVSRWQVTEQQFRIINFRFSTLTANFQSDSHEIQLKVSKNRLYASRNKR